jgi:hypothetical protein
MIELLKENPKAAQVMKDYYIDLMIESSQDLPSHFREFLQERGLEMSNIADMMEAAPRNLFDVFDEHGIIIEIGFMPELPMTGQFTYRVNEEIGGTTSVKRKDVEKYAVEMAIEMLEEQLNSLEKTNEDS